jgi:hypothetical protein
VAHLVEVGHLELGADLHLAAVGSGRPASA